MMKKVLLSLLLAASSLVAVGSPASAASYQGDTLAELLEDPTLHDQHSIVIRFYAAVFARTPDNDGIRFWLDQYDTGAWSTRRIANFFVTGDEFVALYGEGTTNAQFVDAVYPNVLGRQPDANGRSFWIGYLDQGNSRAEMILLVSNSPEFINANPLPSDDRAVPAPVDTNRFFDGLVGYQGTPNPVANDVSRGTSADLYVGYLGVAVAQFDISPASGRTALRGGFLYTLADGGTISYTNPLLDASGRVAHFDINGVPLADLSRLGLPTTPNSIDVDVVGYQLITTGGFTAVRVRIDNDSAFAREAFSFDWTFNSPTLGPLEPINWSDSSLAEPGGALDVVAIYDADALVGGTLVFDVFFDDAGFTQAQTITIDFG